ncbi:MAG: hypothetical protein M1827_002718 [Pycnora praestabilis]|nr:MAG: hypothetical protein M1827_002718 [Pycnora praestabilis]
MSWGSDWQNIRLYHLGSDISGQHIRELIYDSPGQYSSGNLDDYDFTTAQGSDLLYAISPNGPSPRIMGFDRDQGTNLCEAVHANGGCGAGKFLVCNVSWG